MKHTSRFSAMAALALSSCIPLGVHAQEAQDNATDSPSIVVSRPAGYCALDSSAPIEKDLVQSVTTLLERVIEVKEVVAKCSDLAEVHASKSHQLEHFGVVGIVKDREGRMQMVREPLNEVVAALGASSPHFGTDRAGVTKALNQGLTTHKASQRTEGDGRIVVEPSVGIAGSSDTAIYHWTKTKIFDEANVLQDMDGVGSTTVAGSLIVSMFMYQLASAKHPTQISDAIQEYTSKVLEANAQGKRT